MINGDPDLRDRLLGDLSSSIGPPTEGVSGEALPQTAPVIPDHTLLRRIGKGSYGEVWLARNALGTPRAIKIVHRSAFDSDRPYEREFAGIRRFEPLSRSHPSQLNVLHVGRDDAAGLFYYVMELADDANDPTLRRDEPRESPSSSSLGGASSASPLPPSSPESPSGARITRPSDFYAPRTLRSELQRRGRLPGDECLSIGLALATALDHLHRHGLVHRDIKPSNIVFVNGIPKLADIGLVTHVEATLSFVGTEGYLPPEGPGTPQADIYSLGKVLYEMATGRDRQDYPELPTNLIEAPVADRAALAELNEVIVKACQADAKQRYQTAAELHADLALLQSGKSVSRMRTVERRLQFVARAGALVTAIAIIAAGLYLWQARQTRTVRTLAETNARLAERARESERTAQENLYAADMNLAQQALMVDNLRQARGLLQLHVPQPGERDLRGFEWRYLWRQCQGDVEFSLPGHSGGAWSVGFSPDGQRLATGGADGTARLWDLASRREIGSFRHPGVVESLAFSPGGELMALGSAEAVSVWDTRTLGRLRELPTATRNARFSPDGRYLVTLGTNGLLLWETAGWSVAGTCPGPSPSGGRQFRAAFAADGTRLAVVLDREIRVLGVPDLREVTVLPQALPADAFVAFSPDNVTLAFPAPEFGVRLWDTVRQRELKLLPGHTDTIYAAAFSPDGKRLATCSADQTIRLWDVATGQLVRRFIGQADEIYCVAFSPDGKRLASVGHPEGSVNLWDATARPPAPHFREPFGPVGFDLDGQLVAFGEHLHLRSLTPATLHDRGASQLTLTAGRGYAPFLGSLSPDGETTALWAPNEQTMEVWNRREGRLLCSVPSTTPFVLFAPRRGLLATVSGPFGKVQVHTNQTGTVWRLRDGTPHGTVTNIWHLTAISPDERLLVVDEVSTWRLWEIGEESLTPLSSFGPKEGPCYERSAAFSPDGTLLATGDRGGLIRLWAMPSARALGVLTGHTRDQIALAFSPDGRTLASMADDRTLRLWNVAARREMLRFQAPKQDHGDWNLVFAADGRALTARRSDEDGPITWLYYAPSLSEIAGAEGRR